MSDTNGDLISRKAMINMCKEVIAQEWNHKAAPVSWAHAYESFADSLETALAVDAVEVVRCRECKNYNVSRLECHNRRMNGVIGSDGYCSYGERDEP